MLKFAIELNKYSYLAVCFMVYLFACPPSLGYAKQKWEKIDEAELKKTSYEEAPEAGAVILFDRCRMIIELQRLTFEPSVVLEKYCRIKMLDETGYNYANIRILHSEHEDIDNLEARTILTSGKIIELKKGDFYKNNVKIGGSAGDLYEETFTFPALEPGCIVEYKFEKKSKNIYFLDNWYFQNELYTFHSEFTGKVPSIFAYNYYLFPQGSIIPTVNEVSFFEDGREQRTAEFTWKLDNIPGIAKEPHSPPMNSYRTQIFFVMSAIRPHGVKKIPIFDNWESVVEKSFYPMYSDIIKDSKEIKAAAEECTRNSTDKAEKIRDIFNYVKANCRYNESHGAEVFPLSPKATLKNKKGDTADLSALMIQMLLDVDIEAYPAVITTRHNPPFMHNFPSPTQFTKMIVYIFDTEAPLWINPAGSFVNYKTLPWEDQRQNALIINSKTGSFSKTPSSTSVENFISHYATITISPEGSADVYGWVAFSGLCEDICAKKIDSMTDEDRKKYVKEKVCPFNPDAEITALDIPQDLRAGGALRISYSFTSETSVQVISDRLILNPALCHRISSESFESERRVNPIFFEYPYTINVSLRINIPKGFELEKAPRPVNRSRPYGNYIRYVEKGENELYYRKKFTLPEIMFVTESYSPIQKYYHLLEAWDEEKLVFRKKMIPPEQDSTQTGSSPDDPEP